MQVSKITLRRTADCWVAKFGGPDAAAVIALFGTDDIPTPYSPLATAQDVKAAIQKLNPDAEVRLALEHIELCGGACDDCTVALANNDYSGMDDAQEAATRAGIARIGQHLIVGEDCGFSHDRCAVCGGLAGNRHDVGYLREAQ
jgi:hypothetical protein